MFKIIKYGRKLRQTFSTYEQARSHCRKMIRKMFGNHTTAENTVGKLDNSYFHYANPSINNYGFRIERMK